MQTKTLDDHSYFYLLRDKLGKEVGLLDKPSSSKVMEKSSSDVGEVLIL